MICVFYFHRCLDLLHFDFFVFGSFCFFQAGKYLRLNYTSYLEFCNEMSNNGYKLFCSARKRPIPYTRLTPFSTNSDTDSVISVHDSPFAEIH